MQNTTNTTKTQHPAPAIGIRFILDRRLSRRWQRRSGPATPLTDAEYGRAVAATGLTVTACARHLGVTRRTLQRRVAGETPVSVEAAAAMQALLLHIYD